MSGGGEGREDREGEGEVEQVFAKEQVKFTGTGWSGTTYCPERERQTRSPLRDTYATSPYMHL